MSFKVDFPNILPDFITARNFLYFIICREYIDFSSNSKGINELIDEETKLNFYKFLFKASKDPSINLFKAIKENDNNFKRKLNSLVIKKIETIINNLNDLISYCDVVELINTVLSSFHERVDVIGNEYKGKICKYSLIGMFLKKFSLSFQSMQMEKVLIFVESFRQLLECNEILPRRVEKFDEFGEQMYQRSIQLKEERLSEDQVRFELSNIHRNLENVLLDPQNNAEIVSQVQHELDKYKQMYPDISESFFLDTLLKLHNKDLEAVEKDMLMGYSAKFLGSDDILNGKDLTTATETNKESSKKSMLIKTCQLRQRLSEISLNSAIYFSTMGFNNEALLHHKDAICNAKLSRKPDLVAEVGSVGNSLMPINDNPNSILHFQNDSNVNCNTALGNIRDFLLQNMHNNNVCLADLLNQYFISSAPQMREMTPICLIYLSIMFRSFGFESISNTYLVMAASLESMRRTKNHQEVMVEVFSQIINVCTSSGQFQKGCEIFNQLQKFGNGILCSNNQLRSSMLQSSFTHYLLRLDYSKANHYLRRIHQISLAEYGLRKVQILFMNDNITAAVLLCNHIVSFATKKREMLEYNIVRISNGCAALSTSLQTIPDGRSANCDSIMDNLGDTVLLNDLPTLDDTSTQNWGSRDWAIFECRCHWLMCKQLINRKELESAKTHLAVLEGLSSKFYFYHFQRLCQVFRLAITAQEAELQNGSGGTLTADCPLVASFNAHRAQTILSSQLELATRDHMVFLSLLLKLFVRQPRLRRDRNVERHFQELVEFCQKSDDFVGLANCWQMICHYNDAIGNSEEKRRAQAALEFLLENKLTNVPNLDFLLNVV